MRIKEIHDGKLVALHLINQHLKNKHRSADPPCWPLQVVESLEDRALARCYSKISQNFTFFLKSLMSFVQDQKPLQRDQSQPSGIDSTVSSKNMISCWHTGMLLLHLAEKNTWGRLPPLQSGGMQVLISTYFNQELVKSSSISLWSLSASTLVSIFFANLVYSCVFISNIYIYTYLEHVHDLACMCCKCIYIILYL